MLRARHLTEAQIASFHDAGYVFVPGGLAPEDARALAEWAGELARRPVEVGGPWVYHETSRNGDGRRLIARIENLVPFHRGYEALTDLLRASVGQLFHERRIFYATYNRLSEGDVRARYYADKRRSYPPDIEREAGEEYVFRV